MGCHALLTGFEPLSPVSPALQAVSSLLSDQGSLILLWVGPLLDRLLVKHRTLNQLFFVSLSIIQRQSNKIKRLKKYLNKSQRLINANQEKFRKILNRLEQKTPQVIFP